MCKWAHSSYALLLLIDKTTGMGIKGQIPEHELGIEGTKPIDSAKSHDLPTLEIETYMCILGQAQPAPT